MTRRFLALATSLILAAAPAAGWDLRRADVFEARLKQLAKPRLERKQLISAVVGVSRAGQRQIIPLGVLTPGAMEPPTADTLYEIGSITKVFTALALADMVREGKLSLDDLLRDRLPGGGVVPSRSGKEITLAMLASHTSGLPRISSQTAMWAIISLDPYALFSEKHIHHFLANYQLSRDPGAAVEYSNLAYGILGYVLADRDGVDYETMIKKRVCAPLGLRETTITLSDEQQKRFAPPHQAGGRRVMPWDLAALKGAGALRSTVPDLLTFLEAHFEEAHSPLDAAIAMATKPRAKIPDAPGISVGLGWHIITDRVSDETVLFHDGGTGGYRSLAVCCPRRKTAAAILLNSTDSPARVMALLMDAVAPDLAASRLFGSLEPRAPKSPEQKQPPKATNSAPKSASAPSRP